MGFFGLWKTRVSAREAGAGLFVFVRRHMENVSPVQPLCAPPDWDTASAAFEEYYLVLTAADYAANRFYRATPHKKPVLDAYWETVWEAAQHLGGRNPAQIKERTVDRAARYTKAINNPIGDDVAWTVGRCFGSCLGFDKDFQVVMHGATCFAGVVQGVTDALKRLRVVG